MRVAPSIPFRLEPPGVAPCGILGVGEKEFPDRICIAVDYDAKQVRELEQTLKKAKADVVVSGTPIHLGRVVKLDKPIVRVRYELQEIGKPDLRDVLKKWL